MIAEKEITLNQIAVMVEKVGSNVKAVAEGHGVIRSEMRQMEERLTEKIEENSSAIKFVARELGLKIDKVKDEMKCDLGEVKATLNEHVRLPAHA